jgi:hypothetical protein
MMMPKPKGLQIMDYPAMPPVIDDGAREHLEKIISFFDTKCEACVEHYCEACTEKFKALLYDARDYLNETTE